MDLTWNVVPQSVTKRRDRPPRDDGGAWRDALGEFLGRTNNTGTGTGTGRSTVAKEILVHVHYCTRKVHPTHETFCTALDLHVAIRVYRDSMQSYNVLVIEYTRGVLI